jgi:hypothetical protein
MDHEAAVDMLGDELARDLRSIVADMREAMYLGELADLPEITVDAGTIKLRFVIGPSSWLEVEPIGYPALPNDSWRQSHRVKLLHIYRDGLIST